MALAPSGLRRWEYFMNDFLWIGLTAGLLLATLAYVRLCDNA